MKAAILLCDQVLEEYQDRFGQYQDMIHSMLAPFFPGLESTPFMCHQGELPEDIDAFDFYISSGSRSSVYDDEAWIHRLIRFIRQLHQQQKKFIGICFGHQLIAMALGGNVELSSKGWGIGIATNEISQQPEWMAPNPGQLRLLASHQDQVVELAPNTEILAGSDFCPFFLLQWNPHFLSVQGHPEWSVDYARALLDDRHDQYPDNTLEQARQSLTHQPDNQLFARWIRQFIDQH